MENAPDMTVLAVETSWDICSVALKNSSRGIDAEYRFSHRRALTERLPGAVNFLLSDHGLALSDIDAFACGTGPGSFTGVRVAVTFAKLWAQTLNKPLYGINTFTTLTVGGYRNSCADTSFVLTIVPSRKDEAIVGLHLDGDFIPWVEPCVLRVDEIGLWLAGNAPSEPLWVTGDAAHWLPQADRTPDMTIEAVGPFASQIAGLVAQSEFYQLSPVDPETLIPFYVAPPPIRGTANP